MSKKNQHFVSQFWQRLFYELDNGTQGCYLDLRPQITLDNNSINISNLSALTTCPKKNMALEYGYSPKDHPEDIRAEEAIRDVETNFAKDKNNNIIDNLIIGIQASELNNFLNSFKKTDELKQFIDSKFLTDKTIWDILKVLKQEKKLLIFQYCQALITLIEINKTTVNSFTSIQNLFVSLIYISPDKKGKKIKSQDKIFEAEHIEKIKYHIKKFKYHIKNIEKFIESLLLKTLKNLLKASYFCFDILMRKK